MLFSKDPHDVRLVYIACAWLLAHRGHFLYDIPEDNISELLEFKTVYTQLIEYFKDIAGEYQIIPLVMENTSELESVLKQKLKVTEKYKKLITCFYGDNKPKKSADNDEGFPFNTDSILRLLAGGTVQLKDLYFKDDYKEFGSFSLDKNDEEYAQTRAQLGDDAELLFKLKALYDWSLLCELLKNSEHGYISEDKVKIYEQHKEDLKLLKCLVKAYLPDKYAQVFNTASSEANYVAYSGNLTSIKDVDKKYERKNKEEFCKYVKKLLESVSVSEEDKDKYDDCMNRLEMNTFMPKQTDNDNRVIPYQLYYMELKKILANASCYLQFLSEKDDTGIACSDKILSIMKFRVPYFVGPLNSKSEYAWIVRKADGKILPWNINEKVDMDASEKAFINKMTNTCTYYPGANVLPKCSLLYQKFEVLNEINNLSLNTKRLPVEVKQNIYSDLFCTKRKVTAKQIKDYLIGRCGCSKEEIETLAGIDDNIKSSLSSYHSFKNLINNGVISENDAERIIMQRTYTENKARFSTWLKKEFPNIAEEDRRYVCSLQFKDFGRLSEEFLRELVGNEKESGKSGSVMDFLWEQNVNVMELLSNKYTFSEELSEISKEYYAENSKSLSERLDDLYVSTSARRPIIRTLDILHDIIKATGQAPKKIFVEMARGASPDQKNKRTKTRYQQLIELYNKVKDEDVAKLQKELDNMGENVDNRLQSDRLFLYYIQLGKCMYTGQSIDLDKITTGDYNIEHIYPQSKVKDDSIMNNLVLVDSKVNGLKDDTYPISSEIRSKMHNFWNMLYENGLITKEKYTRLTRTTPFTDEEKRGFINRQLVETRQSTKVVTKLLEEMYPSTKIVYVKAGLVTDFRQQFGLLKCRSLNDLHHAKDAYLNVVCGNVYDEKFTEKWFLKNIDTKYSIKTEYIFTNIHQDGSRLFWNGKKSLESVKNTILKNNIHMTVYEYCRKEGLFDQNPIKAAAGLVPRKKNLPTEKYGGYNKPTVSYFILTKYEIKGKRELIILPVELMYSAEVTSNISAAEKYAKYKIEKITGKNPENISFPIGLRKIKINTVFEFDKFRFTLSGSSGGGKCLVMSPFIPLIVDYNTEQYIKALESFVDKITKNPKIVYTPGHSIISKEKNLYVYDLFADKYINGIYSKRINPPIDIIKKGRKCFDDMDIAEQAKTLMQILSTFARKSTGGVDLKNIGGSANSAATVSFSSTLSNWTKTRKKAYIIDISASGLHNIQSIDLLSLL